MKNSSMRWMRAIFYVSLMAVACAHVYHPDVTGTSHETAEVPKLTSNHRGLFAAIREYMPNVQLPVLSRMLKLRRFSIRMKRVACLSKMAGMEQFATTLTELRQAMKGHLEEKGIEDPEDLLNGLWSVMDGVLETAGVRAEAKFEEMKMKMEGSGYEDAEMCMLQADH